MANTIEISAGQTYAQEFDFGTTNITGWKFYGTIKRNLSDADTSAEATASGTASGTSITLTYTDTQMAALATGTAVKYFIDCKAVRASDGAVMNIPPEEPDILIVNPAATRRKA